MRVDNDRLKKIASGYAQDVDQYPSMQVELEKNINDLIQENNNLK